MPDYTTEAFLRAVLVAEEAARFAADTQAAFAAAEDSLDTDWLEVADALQRRLLRSAGVPPSHEAQALRHLRAATYTHPALAAIPVYRRRQRARPGILAPGDVARDVQVLSMDGVPSRLHAAALQLSNGGTRPLLLVSGSLT